MSASFVSATFVRNICAAVNIKRVVLELRKETHVNLHVKYPLLLFYEYIN
jgi:hypothetical protein